MGITTNGHGGFTPELFTVKIPDVEAPLRVSCRWRIANTRNNGAASRYFGSLDLLLSVLPVSAYEADTIGDPAISDATGTPLETLVRRASCTIQDVAQVGTDVIAKVILASSDGFLCRRDILGVRMRHSAWLDTVVPFSTWDQHFPAWTAQDTSNLLPLLPSSPGALLVKASETAPEDVLQLLDHDLEMRLSFNWILPTKPTPRRVAVVSGRAMCDSKQGMHGSQGFFEAAEALGISLIVFDNPGHWLEGKKYAHLRDEFIPMNMSVADIAELPQKMAGALRSRHVDGIVTFTDEYVIATAETAEILGLPTESAQAMLQTHYKHEMRTLVNNSKSSIQALHLGSVHDLDDSTRAAELEALQYPLIVKPCRGQTSKGVRKVMDIDSLREAARMLQEDELIEQGILIESYVDGPELDANFVLWDGEVLFLEVTDNLPCLGDAHDATLAHNFAETVLISNSRLPAAEVERVRKTLHHNLLQLGFRSGVFHVEARMQNSSMSYEDARGDGILDLVVSGSGDEKPDKQPDAFLIEVNVRPPGTGGTWATLFTYGVDMGALQFLRALDDRERFAALSQPFGFSAADAGDGGGAQYWLAHCMVPIHRETILVPEDFFEKVYQALPEIVPYVTRAEMYAEPGTVVSQSGGIGWIAYLLVYSRESRRHVLEMYYRVAAVAEKVLDDVSVEL